MRVFITEIRGYVCQNFVTEQISRKMYSEWFSQTGIKIIMIECMNKWDSEMVSERDSMKWSVCDHWVWQWERDSDQLDNDCMIQ